MLDNTLKADITFAYRSSVYGMICLESWSSYPSIDTSIVYVFTWLDIVSFQFSAILSPRGTDRMSCDVSQTRSSSAIGENMKIVVAKDDIWTRDVKNSNWDCIIRVLFEYSPSSIRVFAKYYSSAREYSVPNRVPGPKKATELIYLMRRQPNLVRVVDCVVAVEVVTVLREHLREHNVPLVPGERFINKQRICWMLSTDDSMEQN